MRPERPVRHVDRVLARGHQQATRTRGLYAKARRHIRRRPDGFAGGRTVTARIPRRAAEDVARLLVELRGVQRSLVVSPLHDAVLAVDDRPAANRLRTRRNCCRGPGNRTRRAGVQVRQHEPGGIGAHETRVHGRLDAGAKRGARRIAGVAVAQILLRPAIQCVACGIRQHRAFELRLLDEDSRRKRLRHGSFGIRAHGAVHARGKHQRRERRSTDPEQPAGARR